MLKLETIDIPIIDAIKIMSDSEQNFKARSTSIVELINRNK